MNIAVLHPAHVPLAIGGAERLWWGFTEYVNRETEHQAELIKLPTPERDVAEVITSYAAWSELDVSSYDAVVCGKYPCWMVDHPDKRVYLLHRLRGLYDTYPPGFRTEVEAPDPDAAALLALMAEHPGDRAALPEVLERLRALRDREGGLGQELSWFPGPFARTVVHWLDEVGLHPGAVTQFATLSRTVAMRPGMFPAGAEVRVAYPMTDLDVAPGKDEGFFFTVSRLDAPKRLDLVVEAMKRSQARCELRIAGTGPEEERLRELAAGDPRIVFLGRLGDERIADLYARCRAVPFVPLDEDFGYITLEAMLAAKPVLTTSDAGGPTELVQDGRTGFVVPPDPGALAAKLDLLAKDRRAARRMGEAGREVARSVTWKSLFDALFAP